MKKDIFILFILALSTISCSTSSNMPTDSRATDETKILYNHLLQTAGKATFFGQQDALLYGVNWLYDNDRSDIKDVCGSHPAVFGWELGHIELGSDVSLDSICFSKIRDGIIQAHQAGGLNTVSWHLDNPVNNQSSWDRTAGTVYKILNDSEINQKYRHWLDILSDFFISLKDENGKPIPILFRPYHENTGDWFWWAEGQCDTDEYIELWRRTVSYLRDVRNVHQLLYIYSPDRTRDNEHYMERYPGDEWVDIFGLDVYLKEPSHPEEFISTTRRSLKFISEEGKKRGKPFVFSETGSQCIPISDWWTEILYPSIKDTHPAYVLVWRNANNIPNHYFAPFPGEKSIRNFLKFIGEKDILLLDDKTDLYSR